MPTPTDSIGIPATIDLLALEDTQTVPVTMPNGTVRTLHFMDAPAYQLFLDVQRTGDDADALRLVRRILPDAPTEEIALLTPRMWQRLVLTAARKIEVVTEVLEKNDGPPPAPASAEVTAAANASAPPRSSRPTRSSTRSTASRARRAGTSSPSPASPTTGP